METPLKSISHETFEKIDLKFNNNFHSTLETIQLNLDFYLQYFVDDDEFTTSASYLTNYNQILCECLFRYKLNDNSIEEIIYFLSFLCKVLIFTTQVMTNIRNNYDDMYQ